MEVLRKSYCSLKTAKAKLEFLQCEDVSPNDAADLFEGTDDCLDSTPGVSDISQAILDLDADANLDNKILPVIDSRCDSVCRREKELAKSAIKVAENELIKNQETLNGIRDGLNLFGDSVRELREQTYSHEEVLTELTNKAYKFFPKGSKDPEVISTRQKLLDGIETAIGFGTTDTYENIIAATEKEITIAKDKLEKSTDKSEKKLGVMRRYKNKVMRGIQIMSNTDKVAKVSKAVGGLVVAIGKFQSNDVKTIFSGVADVTSILLDFLPPPASIIGGMYII